MIHRFLFALMVMAACGFANGAPKKVDPPAVSQGKDGKLEYVADDKGNRIPDFSFAGYHAGADAIPTVPVRVIVTPVAGDNTAPIQSAIDYVSSLPPDQRGAVLLDKGKFEILGGLKISASGVVLRGSGAGADGTTLVATGHDRRTLITIVGKDDRTLDASEIKIDDAFVPVNATQLKLAKPHNLKIGDSVFVKRPSSAEWIKQIGMDDFGGGLGIGWKPGTRDLLWDRKVIAVDGDTITIDAPITTAIDSSIGGGTVVKYTFPGRIENAGVENLSCESTFDSSNPKDESHPWFGVSIQNAQDAWVRQSNFSHFAGGAVNVLDSCKQVTVEDCKSLAPISEIGGWRRHAFFTAGQLTLFLRCWSEDARHDYAVGFCAEGPNVFVQCESLRSLEDSGSIDSWASGILFDNVRIDGNAINFGNREYQKQFSGWCAANSVLWNCYAAVINCARPEGAMNWSFGSWAQFTGDGAWVSSNESVKPVSLYYAQLAERLGSKAKDRGDLMPRSTDASSSPSLEDAAKLNAASLEPAPLLSDWISEASKRNPISTNASGAKTIDAIAKPQAATAPKTKQLTIQNGWLVIDGNLATGGRQNISWWQGSPRGTDLSKVNPNPTRFVPGRIGWGLTDDLDSLTDSMQQRHLVALEHHYGLWYERRRDDHERIRRMNGDVWPPFYEQPFARSGQGSAWDGLSKYDLTKYNPWYWDRLKTFAELCQQKGLVLIQQHYFQHNIIEAGAHWVDCPWRSANNINETGFPEPPPFAGDKRIFQAELFYDETNPVRRRLHQAFIRQSLANFADESNVIHLTSEEFTGPLHFVQFWLDTIAQWMKETGKQPLIGLSATKDVQDAILADATRAAIVNIIDIRYWWYQQDGQLYAPPGGANLAPRQHQRVFKPKVTNFDQVFRAVREYRAKYPEKVVLYSSDGEDANALAALMGGASLPELKFNLPDDLLAAIPAMTPFDLPEEKGGPFALAKKNEQYLILAGNSKPIEIDLSSATGAYVASWISADNGKPVGEATQIAAGKTQSFNKPGNGRSLLWLRRK